MNTERIKINELHKTNFIMEKEFVTYEQALALKELGFNEECFAMFMRDNFKEKCWCKNSEFNDKELFTSTPTYSQAFRWFRDAHGLDHDISKNEKEMIDYVSGKGMVDIPKYRYGYTEDSYHSLGTSMRYEEAESACLDKLIEIVKTQTKQS